jgi:hypothetical protein
MANTIITTNRTIEVLVVDEDYMMGLEINVQSVVFIPGQATDVVDIIENNIGGTNPVKVQLYSGDGEPRGWIFNQRLQLGFTYADGVFTGGAKVIFNIGELKGT